MSWLFGKSADCKLFEYIRKVDESLTKQIEVLNLQISHLEIAQALLDDGLMKAQTNFYNHIEKDHATVSEKRKSGRPRKVKE